MITNLRVTAPASKSYILNLIDFVGYLAMLSLILLQHCHIGFFLSLIQSHNCQIVTTILFFHSEYFSSLLGPFPLSVLRNLGQAVVNWQGFLSKVNLPVVDHWRRAESALFVLSIDVT